MPQSNKTTMVELAAYYEAGGVRAARQKYPKQDGFLIVLPDDQKAPLVWTPQDSNTQMLLLAANKQKVNLEHSGSVSRFASRASVIVPLEKSNRNNEPHILVGRDDTCDIRFATLEVSKVHAEIIKTEAGYAVKDSDSKNGTFVNNFKMLPGKNYNLEVGSVVAFSTVGGMFVDFDHLITLLDIMPRPSGLRSL